jgi:hypothetical protein
LFKGSGVLPLSVCIPTLDKCPAVLFCPIFVVDSIASDGPGAARVTTATATIGDYLGKTVKTPMFARDLVARALATNPRATSMLLTALKFNSPVKVYVPLIAAEIQKQSESQSSQDEQK